MEYVKLLDFLESELSEFKEEIKQHNKLCDTDKSGFLCKTYMYKEIDDSKYLFTTFENDLPAKYRDMILEKIKEFMKINNYDVVYNTLFNYPSK